MALACSVVAPYIPVSVMPWIQLIPALDTAILTGLFTCLMLHVWVKSNSMWPAVLFGMYMLLMVSRNFSLDTGPTCAGSKMSHRLTLLTLNVQQFSNDTQCVNETVRLIKMCDPDVICLQEFGLYYKWPDVRSVAADFSQRTGMPHYDFTPQTGNIFGTAFFSKHRILQTDTVFQLLSHTNEAKIYRLAVEEDTLTVCNVHLQSFNFSNYHRPDALPVAGVIGMQARQAGQIIDHMATSQYAVVAGDLNAVPGSRVYREFSLRFRDAQRIAGRGWIPTHHHLPARIDFVFSGYTLCVQNTEVIGDFPTDHRALLTTLQW